MHARASLHAVALSRIAGSWHACSSLCLFVMMM
jgi:hypothetical protein